MSQPTATLLGAALIAAAIFASRFVVPSYQISSGNGAWRVNTATGDVAYCETEMLYGKVQHPKCN